MTLVVSSVDVVNVEVCDFASADQFEKFLVYDVDSMRVLQYVRKNVFDVRAKSSPGFHALDFSPSLSGMTFICV